MSRAQISALGRIDLPGADFLAQQRDQRADATAVALNYRGEFIALRHFHADAADIDVGDLVSQALLDQVPVDRDPAAIGANDLAADDGLGAVRPRAGDPERLSAVFGKPRTVGAHDVFLKQPEK